MREMKLAQLKAEREEDQKMESMTISERLEYLKSALLCDPCTSHVRFCWTSDRCWPAWELRCMRAPAVCLSVGLMIRNMNSYWLATASNSHERAGWGPGKQRHESNRGMTSLGTLDLSIQGW